MEIKSVQPNISINNLNSFIEAASRNDEDILDRAKKRADSKSSNSLVLTAKKALPYIAVGSLAVAAGAKTPGKLSNKVMSASHVLGTYAIVDVLFNALNGAEKFINKNNKKQEENHNIFKPLIMIGAGFLGIQLLFKGFDKIAKKIAEKKPKVIMNVLGEVKKGFEFFDKTKLASKVQEFKPIYKNFALKHPKLTSKISNNIFPIILTSYIGSELALTLKNNKLKEKTFTNSVTSDVLKREYARQLMENPVKISKN